MLLPCAQNKLEGKVFREGLVHDSVPLLCVQDPKYPAENLLSEDGIQPWLGCPKDRRRQLSVELQLERASPIGYVDVGTSLSPSAVQQPGLCPTVGSAALNPLTPVLLAAPQGTAAVPFCRLRLDVPHGPVTSPISPWCPQSH